MKYIKDLLFFEINATGSNPDRDSTIQLAAVLLDKDNLLEKSYFNSYIRASYLDSVILEHSKILQISQETLKKSPKIYDVIKKFHKQFGINLLLASYNIINLLFLKNAFKKAVVTFDYDYHFLDLWTLGYVYTVHYGLKKMPSFYTFRDFFKLEQQNPSDALERVRIEAEIFKRIIKEA